MAAFWWKPKFVAPYLIGAYLLFTLVNAWKYGLSCSGVWGHSLILSLYPLAGAVFGLFLAWLVRSVVWSLAGKK